MTTTTTTQREADERTEGIDLDKLEAKACNGNYITRAEQLALIALARQAAPEAPAAATDQPSAGQVDERARKEKENGEFTEWWNREQACPEHSIITENAAHAAWQERARRASLTPTAPQAATTASPRCTCPSGDGSLRWPCPTHPPEDTTASASTDADLDYLLEYITNPAARAACQRKVDAIRAALARAPLPAQQVQAVDLARDAERLDYLDKHAVIAAPQQSIREAIDAAMSRPNTTGGRNE